MSLRVIFGLILVVAAQGDAWAETPATAMNIVFGRVIDAATKKPVRGFEIAAYEVPAAHDQLQLTEIRTLRVNDRGGRFRLELPNRPAILRVTAPDRLPTYAITTTGQGQPPGPLEIALEQGILISGKVSTAEGTTIAGADVRYRLQSRPVGGFDEYSVQSDAQGAFRARVQPGETRLRFVKDGFVPEELSRNVTTEANPPIDVKLYPAITVSGSVRNDQSEPVPGARIRFSWRARSGEVKDALADDRGRFRLEMLRRGEYRVEVSKASMATRQVDSFAVPSPGEAVFVLDRGATVTGTVTGVTAEEAPFVFIYIGKSTMTAANLEGKFGIRGVPSGESDVFAEFVTGGKVKRSVRKRVSLTNGAAVTVNLAFEGQRRLRGKLLEGDKEVHPGVVELRRQGSSERAVVVTTDESGSFEVIGLEPGDYGVSVNDREVLGEAAVHFSGAEQEMVVRVGPLKRQNQLDAAPVTRPSS